MGAADEELAGDQKLEKVARSRRGVASISARGVPKSLGKSLVGCAKQCDERARMLAVLYSTFPGLLPPL